MMTITGIIVLLLHILLILWFRRSNEYTEAHALPFKLEVSMLTSPATPQAKDQNALRNLEPTNQEPKPSPKKNPQNDVPIKQKPEDLAAIEKLIESPPTQQITKKSRSKLATTQTVSSSVFHSHTKDNFPESDLHNPSPEYPEMALFLGYQGTAIARVRVSPKGLSEGVDIVRSSGHKILDESTAKALKQWRFTATNHSDSVIIMVHFVLEE